MDSLGLEVEGMVERVVYRSIFTSNFSKAPILFIFKLVIKR
jgi:hypothetical protein